MTRHAPLALPLMALPLLAAPAWACLHLPRDYQGSVEQTSQQAIVLWHAGRQDLVLAPSFVARGAQAPARLAWIVPVPSVPDAYGVAEGPDPFLAMFQAWEASAPKRRGETRGRAPEAQSAKGGIELLPPAVAGEYAIQPIKATGAEGAAALNAWLEANGFSVVPPANMEYYVQRGWIWLAVRADVQAARGALRPLKVSFASPEVVYPLKFSTHQGTFGVTLYVVTAAPLRGFELRRPRELEAFGFEGEVRAFDLPPAVRALEQGVTLPADVVVTRLHRASLPGAEIAGWTRDLALQPAADGDVGAAAGEDGGEVGEAAGAAGGEAGRTAGADGGEAGRAGHPADDEGALGPAWPAGAAVAALLLLLVVVAGLRARASKES